MQILGTGAVVRSRPAPLDHDARAAGEPRLGAAVRVADLERPPAGRRPGSPGARRGPGGSPHGTSPTAMLARGRDADELGAAQVGQLALDRSAARAPASWRVARRRRHAARAPRGSPRSGRPLRPAAPRRAGRRDRRDDRRLDLARPAPRPCPAPMQSRSAPAASDSTAASGMPRPARRAGHVEGVADDHPVEAEPAAQQPEHRRGSGCAGRSGSRARYHDVRGHHRRRSRPRPPPRTAPARGRAASSRSTSTVGSSRWLSCAVSPWPGKCLAQAATPASCSPVDPGRDVRGDPGRVGAEAAGADHRVVRVAVDVGDRAEVEVDARPRPARRRSRRPVAPGQVEVVDGAERGGPSTGLPVTRAAG